jgi:hypothetical protein
MSVVKLTVGSELGWANPDKSNSCVMCGKTVGKNPYYVHLSIYGAILTPDFEGSESQGFWQVGSECAKKIQANLLIKMEA